uniref:Uncharacterized protein n=1 Tax=Setaria digitata TaxID=48799 RepID=A0A915PDX8_9BILA
MTSVGQLKQSVLCRDPLQGFNFCYYAIQVIQQYWNLMRDFDINNAENMTDEEIVNFIGNLLLNNLPRSTNQTYQYIQGVPLPYCLLDDGKLARKMAGVNKCIFLLDSCSMNKIYIGPFTASNFDQSLQSTERINKSFADVVLKNFTKICSKSECIHYLSPMEFFFYCCCDKNYELCAYTTDGKLLSYARKNTEAWLKDPAIRSFRDARIYFVGERIYGRPWIYRKFVYSMPTVDEYTGKVISSANNIPLHLCAIGSFNITIGDWKKQNFVTHLATRKMLAEPRKFCYFTASLQFEQTDREPPTSDVEEICKKDECNVEAPICLQDLISQNYVIATFRCCCSTDDLCNHAGNKYYGFIEQIVNIKRDPNEAVQYNCIRKIFLPLHDPFCRPFMPVLTNLIQCSCSQSTSAQQPCDADFDVKARMEGPNITVPLCYQTIGNLPRLAHGEYDFGIIGAAKYKKVKTTNYPLCYDMITINEYKHGIEHRSGSYDEVVDYVYAASEYVRIARRLMTFAIPVPNGNRNMTRYLFICYQRVNYEACNGFFL